MVGSRFSLPPTRVLIWAGLQGSLERANAPEAFLCVQPTPRKNA